MGFDGLVRKFSQNVHSALSKPPVMKFSTFKLTIVKMGAEGLKVHSFAGREVFKGPGLMVTKLM